MASATTSIIRRRVLGALLGAALAVAYIGDATPALAANDGLWIAAGSIVKQPLRMLGHVFGGQCAHDGLLRFN